MGTVQVSIARMGIIRLCKSRIEQFLDDFPFCSPKTFIFILLHSLNKFHTRVLFFVLLFFCVVHVNVGHKCKVIMFLI